MSKRCVAISIAFLLLAQPTYGVWYRTESVEWRTNVSDVVIVGEVQDVGVIARSVADANTKSFPPQKEWQSARVTCNTKISLKGERLDSVRFLEHYRREQQDPPTDDQPLRVRDQILIFAVKNAPR